MPFFSIKNTIAVALPSAVAVASIVSFFSNFFDATVGSAALLSFFLIFTVSSGAVIKVVV